MIIKNCSFNVKIECDLRNEFVATCKKNSINTSALIRRFMNFYIAWDKSDSEIKKDFMQLFENKEYFENFMKNLQNK
jgi:hypothetical protein